MYDIIWYRCLVRNEFIFNQVKYEIDIFYLNLFISFVFIFLTFLIFFLFLLLIVYFIFLIKGCYDVKIHLLLH